MASRPRTAVAPVKRMTSVRTPGAVQSNSRQLEAPGVDEAGGSKQVKHCRPHYMRSTASSRARRRVVVVADVKSSKVTKIRAPLLKKMKNTGTMGMVEQRSKVAVADGPFSPMADLSAEWNELPEGAQHQLQDSLPLGSTALTILKKGGEKPSEYSRESIKTEEAKCLDKSNPLVLSPKSHYGSVPLPLLTSSTVSPSSSLSDFHGLSVMFNGEHRWWLRSTSSRETHSSTDEFEWDFTSSETSSEQLDQDGQQKENEKPPLAAVLENSSKDSGLIPVPFMDESVPMEGLTPSSSEDGAFYTPQGKIFAPVPSSIIAATPITKLSLQLRRLNFQD